MLLAWLPDESWHPAPKLDLIGLLLLSPGVATLIYALTMAADAGLGSGTLVMAVAGAALVAGYALHALRRGARAAIDLRLFRHRPFAVATGLIFLSGGSLFGLLFLLPLYYQQVRGSDPFQAGLLLAPQGVGMIAALLVAGVLVDRHGPRYIVLAGIVITIAGTLPFTRISTVDNDLVLTVALLVRGFGLGAAGIPLTAAAYRSLTEEEIPRAASALVTAQRLGASLGTVVLAVLLHRAVDAGSRAQTAPGVATLATAFEQVFWWTVALSGVALALAWLLPGPADRSARFRDTVPDMGDGMQSTGRRADAARNDARILAAARDVFVELGSDAPVATIAERAGVGMGTLYRRFPSKEDLVRALSIASMSETRQAAERALTHPDPWQGFCDFIDACVEAGADGSPRLTAPFQVTEEILRESRRAREAVQRLVDRAQASGDLRDDVNAHDIVLLLHVLRELRVAHRRRDPALRRRFQAVVLDGLRPTAAHPLPAPPATWEDVVTAWQVMAGADRGPVETGPTAGDG